MMAYDTSNRNIGDDGEEGKEEQNELAAVTTTICALIEYEKGSASIDGYSALAAAQEIFQGMAAEIAEKLEAGGEIVDFDSIEKAIIAAKFTEAEHQHLVEVQGLLERWAAIVEELNLGLSALQLGEIPRSWSGAW